MNGMHSEGKVSTETLGSNQTMQGYKILIADDDRVTHIKFKGFLQQLGLEVLHAYDGLEAISKAREERPHILLLDISMPGMDGRDVCKHLKRDADTASINIIMVTGRDTQLDRLVGFELGADDYIEKPCDPQYLMRKVKSILGLNPRA